MDNIKEGANNVDKPLISIVTICYNTVSVIEYTILSVLNQTYPNLEYIIIDGGSKDGTTDIIHKYKNQLAYFVSEPDNGIYDAMNKGIKHATGKWINFMNAGDVFASDDAVERSLREIDINTKVIYGDRIAEYTKASYHEKPAPIDELSSRFPIFHQSTFIDTSVMKEFGYDTRYKICGDFNFFHKLYKRGSKFQYVEVVISKCDCVSGVSNTLGQAKHRVYEDCLIVHGEITYKDRIKIVYAQLASFIKLLWFKYLPMSYERWRYKSYDQNPYLTKI